jgi:hypothetical protein
MSKKILQINFKFKVPRSDYEKATLDQFAKPIANVKGLLWKVWIMNENKKEAGGIYLFNDESSVKAYLEGNIVAELMKHPALSDIEAKVFDVMDKHSKVTHGPVD